VVDQHPISDKVYAEAAAWLALGSDVDVVIGDTLFSIRSAE